MINISLPCVLIKQAADDTKELRQSGAWSTGGR